MSNTNEKSRKNHIIYGDHRFKVTSADIRTRTAFYPVSDTVGRIRRDILYMALFFAGLIGAAMWLYHDLWYTREKIFMGSAITALLFIGTQVSMFQLDARGFPSRIWIARSSTIKKIFDAISEARAITAQSGGRFEPEDDASDEY